MDLGNFFVIGSRDHTISWVGRKPQRPKSPAPGSTEHYPKSDPVSESIVWMFPHLRQLAVTAFSCLHEDPPENHSVSAKRCLTPSVRHTYADVCQQASVHLVRVALFKKNCFWSFPFCYIVAFKSSQNSLRNFVILLYKFPKEIANALNWLK